MSACSVRGRHRLRGAPALALAVLPALLSCSGHTLYHLVVDGRSYLTPAERSAEILIPAAPGSLTLYILPGVQVDPSGSGADAQRRRGIVVRHPLQTPPPSVELAVRVSGRVSLVNRHATETIPGSTVEVVLAAVSAADIYSEGAVLSSSSFPATPAGQQDSLEFSAAVAAGNPLYDMIASGGFRTGVRVVLAGGAPALLPATYRIEALTVEVEGYPFRLIP